MSNQPFTYTYQKSKKSRNISIKITPKKEIIVSAPFFTPKWCIDKLLDEKRTWIEKTLAKIEQSFPKLDPNTLQIFGKIYHKIESRELNLPLGVELMAERIIINSLSNNHNTLIKRFLKSTAEKYIVPRTHALSQKMQLEFKKITLREQITRWGSCSTGQNLNFNWHLVHFETPVIDYVIIHELAHLKHHNHSSHFWQLVAQFDLEFRLHRSYLKRLGGAFF